MRETLIVTDILQNADMRRSGPTALAFEEGCQQTRATAEAD